ncbi:hypothetical protein HY639_01310 [Candidatus Woesearchaeota archaeon]|nr:hypothetical protein [Candidatus Woesearchaeota archaeon]
MTEGTLLFRLSSREEQIINDWRKNHNCIYLVKNLKVLLTEEEKEKHALEKYPNERLLYIDGGEFYYVFSVQGTRQVVCPCNESYKLPMRKDIAEGKYTPLCGCE